MYPSELSGFIKTPRSFTGTGLADAFVYDFYVPGSTFIPYGNIVVVSLKSLKLRSKTKSLIRSHSIVVGFPMQLVAQNGRHIPSSLHQKSSTSGHLHIPSVQSAILGPKHSSKAQLSHVKKSMQFSQPVIPHRTQESPDEHPKSQESQSVQVSSSIH